ncbi:hypothetical protein B9Z65_3212 [Elsinoe australis]|uniref:Uncharacterized protein n=1 Tax=Elsinoe australis TaxID=40998 RepID=A0A2P7ZUP9_9PEZI|nr:hypothetical protein B9Z65_3212 [Elsinoe australis]
MKLQLLPLLALSLPLAATAFRVIDTSNSGTNDLTNGACHSIDVKEAMYQSDEGCIAEFFTQKECQGRAYWPNQLVKIDADFDEPKQSGGAARKVRRGLEARQAAGDAKSWKSVRCGVKKREKDA